MKCLHEYILDADCSICMDGLYDELPGKEEEE